MWDINFNSTYGGCSVFSYISVGAEMNSILEDSVLLGVLVLIGVVIYVWEVFDESTV